MFTFLTASWWKMHSHVLEFLSTVFACLMSVLPWVSSYAGVWTRDQAGHCPLIGRYFQPCTLHEKKTVLKLKSRRSLGPWQLPRKKPPLEKRVRSQWRDGLLAHRKGSLCVSWNLPIYPSPESTLKLASHLGQNVGLGEGRVGSFTKTYFTCTILTDQGLITETKADSLCSKVYWPITSREFKYCH